VTTILCDNMWPLVTNNSVLQVHAMMTVAEESGNHGKGNQLLLKLQQQLLTWKAARYTKEISDLDTASLGQVYIMFTYRRLRYANKINNKNFTERGSFLCWRFRWQVQELDINLLLLNNLFHYLPLLNLNLVNCFDFYLRVGNFKLSNYYL